MALITFLSDFGQKDHYVAAVKARILAVNPGLRIIDISHNVNHFDIANGSYLLNSVFRDFPKGTVHLVAIDASGSKRCIAVHLEDHYFVCPDNGLLGLISEKKAQAAVELYAPKQVSEAFAAKEILASSAARLASSANINELGNPVKEFSRMLPRLSRASKKQISGHVIHVDHYGNLITNIRKTDFEILSKEKTYSVQFGRESLAKVNHTYYDADDGDCFCLFNHAGHLEIGINKGNASELLGLGIDAPVSINFEE